jgi:hypothetical protein
MYLPESQDNCGSGGMLFTATRAQMAPPHGYRQTFTLRSIHSAHGFGGHRGDALEHTECTSVTHIIYGMESCTTYIGKLHEICRFWWYELHVHRGVYRRTRSM